MSAIICESTFSITKDGNRASLRPLQMHIVCQGQSNVSVWLAIHYSVLASVFDATGHLDHWECKREAWQKAFAFQLWFSAVVADT